jgi:hypothetical protein
LQYHLRKDLGAVVATDPCIVVDPVALAAVPESPLRVVPGERTPRSPTTPAAPAAASLELAVALVSLTDQLLRVVGRLLGDEHATATVPRLRAVENPPREDEPSSRETERVPRAVPARNVSQSEDPFSDGLTDVNRSDPVEVSRGAAPSAREDLAQLVAPLAELARRCNLPGVDELGLARLARFDPDHVHNAVRHVTDSIRGGASVRRPFGLLISELDRGRHRTPPPGRASPVEPRESSRVEPIEDDPVVLADWTDDAVEELFTTVVRGGLSPSLQSAPAPLRRLLVAEYLATAGAAPDTAVG